MNWLDLLFAAILGWNAWIGLKTGLMAGLAKLLGTLLGLAAAFNFYRPLADALNLKWNLAAKIGGLLPLAGKTKGGALGTGGAVELFNPQGPGGFASPKLVYFGLQGIGESVTHTLATGILDILCFLIIYLLVSKLIALVGSVAGKISRMILLGPLDRAGGLLLGAVKGAFICAVVVAVMVSLQLPAAYISGGQKSSLFSLALQKSSLTPYFLKALALFKSTFPGWPV